MNERWFLGSDLAIGENNDLVAENGDLAVVEGEECLQANLRDRLYTSPGAIIWHPTFGGGLLERVGQGMSDADLEDLAVTARHEIEKDPRVKRVVTCEATRGEDDAAIYIEAVVETVTGQVTGNLVFPFPLGGV